MNKMEQMKIEILEPSNMVQKGSSLIRLLMNDHTPVLDLLVREAIQNSLDAAALDGNNERPVSVKFQTGVFNKNMLNQCLEHVTDNLNDRFQSEECKFLSISDRGTQGLTGPMNIEDVKDDEDMGNLLKLVYDICKPQEREGAGGAWGIGKTIYYRIGIGLVFYYSRFFNTQTKQYDSRLVGCMVENEKSHHSLIPQYKDRTKYGIAWWGDCIRENKTIPITDSEYIRDFLNIFGISEYKNDETGTCVIIPYIDEERLLNNNPIEYRINNNEILIPSWRTRISEYLRMAVQRWYYPRLENKAYKYGKWLKVYIDNERFVYDEMAPIFKLEQALYNRATGRDTEDYAFAKDIQICVEEIKVNGIESRVSGKVAFTKVGKEILGMCPPINDYHPNINVGLRIDDITKNNPIIAFCRKPGMIVAYKQDGEWLKDVPCCEKDNFIIAVYALNSDVLISDLNIDLEQYVRKGENADHAEWNDTSYFANNNPNIVSRIKKNTAKKISAFFTDDDEDGTPQQISGLGRMLGKMILPPLGFGTKPTSKVTGGGRGGDRIPNHKPVTYKLIDIGREPMVLKYQVITTKKAKVIGFDLGISSKQKSISMREWEEEMMMDKPFEISKVVLTIKSIDGRKETYDYEVNTQKTVWENHILEMKLEQTSSNTFSGVNIELKSEHECEMVFSILISLYRRDVYPTINFK